MKKEAVELNSCAATEIQPLISIIVPVFNAGGYLRTCLDSIASQSYSHLQVILIDDGSTDESAKICDQFEQRDPRFEVLHKKNSGVSDSRNQGLMRARGNLIGFVDSDDWIHPQMYEELYHVLQNTGADFAVAAFWNGRTIPEVASKPLKREHIRVLSQQEYAKIFFKIGSQKTVYYIWNTLFRRSALNGVHFSPRFSVGEDVPFVCNAILNADKIAILDQKLYFYREGTGVTGHFNDGLLKLPDVWNSVLELCQKKAPQYCYFAQVNCARSNFTLLTELLLSGNWKKEKYIVTTDQCIRNLKAKKKLLMKADIDLKRKLAVQCYCMNYRLCAKVIELVNQWRQKA